MFLIFLQPSLSNYSLCLYICPFHASCRHVMLPKDIAKRVPKTHLMSETEWRNLGVQQSQGWVHYMIHQPGILFDKLFHLNK